jgi:phosphatidylglycerol:prolipoprotein diacylglycerol transferase
MSPIAGELTLFGVTRPLGGYGVAMALGMLIAALMTVRAAHRAREDVGATIACAGYTVAGGLAGAWLLSVIVETAREGSIEQAIETGGLVFYGAIPGGALAAWLGTRGLGVSFAKMLDLSIPALAAGHAIGRIGCFLGGCCFGSRHDGALAVIFTHPMAPGAHPPIPRHPVQLYESAGLIALGLAFAIAPLGRVDGRRALGYVIAYAVLRLITEMVRGDVVRGLWGGLSTSQIISIVVAAMAALALYRLHRRAGSSAVSPGAGSAR